jgi:uncharacterized membrane protein YkvA (DUF1232 family)
VSVVRRLRRRAAALARELTALVLAYRDPRTPFAARAVTLLVLAYAFSPLDLIPDVIPVLGLLDDLILVPLGIALVLRLLPPEVLRDARAAARTRPLTGAGRRLGRWGALAVAAAWLGVLAWLAWLLLHRIV